MSLKAWAGLLGEFGRQSEAYATRQQELEDKRMEEERENRRMTALLAKEQGMASFNVKLGQDAAETERNRQLSPREQEDREQKRQLVGAQIDSYKALAGQRESKTVTEEEVDALAAQISEQNGGDMVVARAQARAMLSGGGGKTGTAGGSGATGTAGALKLGNADLVKDEKDEQTGKTFKRYLNGAKVPDYSEDEFVQIATERANAWREQKGKGLMNAEPSEEDTSAFLAEQVKALKEANAEQHKAAFEESKRVFAEFNAQPGGLIAPQGKAGQPEDTGKQPSLTDKIGKPNANATIDFEALFKARDDIESNGKDFRADGKPVKSSAGAMYKNQVMPATAADPGLGVKPAKITKGMTEKEKAAEYNRVGDDYLKALVDRYDGNIATAYAAYNAGFGRIDRWIENGADPADLPQETQDYVGNIMAKYESYVSKKSNVLDGQVQQGTLDPSKPIAMVKVDGGKTATINTISINEDGLEVLIPTVSRDGRIMDEDEAVAHYRQTNEHFGKFSSIFAANKYADSLHRRQEGLLPENAAPGKMPQEWVNGVLSKADRERAASKQQPQKKGLLADPSPSPFGGFEAAAGAGMAPDEEAQGGESFGTTVGKAARGAQEGAEAVGKGALYLRDQGEKVGKLDWWKEQIAKLKDWRDESLEAAKARAGINDQVLEAMYAEEAKKGVPVEQFIKDFIEAYSGRRDKMSDRKPTDVTGIRG